MFHTYIIYSETIDKYYTGHTSTGVEKRLERHNDGWNPSTKHGIPWQMKYYKSFETKPEVIKWENFIKHQKSSDLPSLIFYLIYRRYSSLLINLLITT